MIPNGMTATADEGLGESGRSLSLNGHDTSYTQHNSMFSSVGETLLENGQIPSMNRPFLDERGRKCVVLPTGEMIYNNAAGQYVPKWKKHTIKELRENGLDNPVWNATTMRVRDWIDMDRSVVRAVRQPLVAWSDLMSRAGTGGFNGMMKLTHEYEAMTDPGEAIKDMDAISEGRTDAPLFILKSIPLPITHSSFWFSRRRLDVSRNSNTPLSTVMAEASARRIGEMVERTTIGTETGLTFGTQTAGYGTHTGTSTEYGYTNFPYRITKTDLTTPTGSNPEAVLQDVLEMIQLMQDNGFYGPFVLYHSNSYSQWLNNDYFRTGSTSAVRSLRDRLKEAGGVIEEIKLLPFLTSGYQLLLVQHDRQYMEAINGMDITTLQWESKGGMQLNFRVLAIWVPLFKSPYSGVAPIIHATTS